MKRSRSPIFVCLFMLIMLYSAIPGTSTALANSYLILPDGSGDLPTIQDAITAAADGDTISLGDGVFTGPGNRDLNYGGKSITVHSLAGDPNLCTIDCEGSVSFPKRAFVFGTGVDAGSVLAGITVTNGFASLYGGGIRMNDGASPTIRNCIFVNNQTNEYGAAIYCGIGTDPTISECLFIDNYSAIEGGAIMCYRSAPELVSCEFRNNVAAIGGAVSNYRQCGTVMIDCHFEDNEGNTGGAVFSYISAPTLSGCSFINNYSNGNGGAFSSTESSPQISNCLFSGNQAAYEGGGLFAGGSGPNVITGCTFISNSSPQGGGIRCQDTEMQVTSCTFYSNTSVSGSSASLLRSDVSFDLTVFTFGNDSAAIASLSPSYIPTLTCCNIFGHDDGDWTGDIADQLGVDGNLSVDPIFCSASSGDVSLRNDSPCAAENNPDCGQIGSQSVGCMNPTGVGNPLLLDGAPLVFQNYPNPFNPQTTISYFLPGSLAVTLQIFDVTGRLVRTLVDGALQRDGYHETIWNGRDDAGRLSATGLYFLTLSSSLGNETRRMTLLK